jgi:two-component system, OmpR family, sensor histidine kinase VanS
VNRAPGFSVRLKLTLSYAGFLMLTASLSAAGWLFVLGGWVLEARGARAPARRPGPRRLRPGATGTVTVPQAGNRI